MSAILGKEAFEAAGDASRFPEQLKYAQPWHARRLVRANFDVGLLRSAALPPGTQLCRNFRRFPGAGQADTGAYNPVLGYSYQELATMSRSMHHSQGTGAIAAARPGVTTFGLLAGEPVSKDLFDGIDTTWNRLPGGAAVGALIDEAIAQLRHGASRAIAAGVDQSAPARSRRFPIRWPRVKLAELDEAIALCAGLYVEAEAGQPEVSPGSHAGGDHHRAQPLQRSRDAGRRRGRGHLERAAHGKARRPWDTTRAPLSRSNARCRPTSRIRSRIGW